MREDLAMTHDRPSTARVVAGLASRAAGSAGTYEHRDPATGAAHATVPLAGGDDVAAAVADARAAFPAWRDLDPAKRSRILFKLADLLERSRSESAAISALDNGT